MVFTECVCVCVLLIVAAGVFELVSSPVVFVGSLCDKDGSRGSMAAVVHSLFFVSFHFVSTFLSSPPAASFSMCLGEISINNLNLHNPYSLRSYRRQTCPFPPFSVDQISGKTLIGLALATYLLLNQSL